MKNKSYFETFTQSVLNHPITFVYFSVKFTLTYTIVIFTPRI